MRPVALLLSALLAVKADVEDFCGYAPLCGDADSQFDWETGNLPDELTGTVLVGAELEFSDCCSLADTQPQEECQIVDPTGEHYRTITSSDPICGDDEEFCEEGSCSEYQLVIHPFYEESSESEGCCDSCTCFGDPQCIDFAGETKIWILCDGREVPHEDSIFDMCRITERRCDKEKDHAGNDCVYLADDPKGRGWQTGKLGSPCVPNPESPPSTIVMYSVPDQDFELILEHGERGIIYALTLELSCGTFELDAETCLTDREDAWNIDGPPDLPEFFSFNDLVEGYDVHWSIVDPDSGIAITLRCHANHFDGDDTHYVPRINIEDLSDPVPGRDDTSGFCVSGEFDTGLATTDHTDNIFSNELCLEGLQESDKREIMRALCKNPGLPSSAHDSCIHHFCLEYYPPMFADIAECVATFSTSLAEGFCKGVTYTPSDASECIEQWFDLGAVETIEQYYNDQAGCTTEYQTELEKCQSGVTIQYRLNNGNWRDEIAIPDDYCPDSGPIILTMCDHPRLFDRRIRLVQKTAHVACAPVNMCKKVDGLRAVLGLVKETPYPTAFPTSAPTGSPTPYPTPYPTVPPSPFPTSFPTPFPSDGPMVAPTPFPTPAQNEYCPDPLCDTETEYVGYEPGEDSFHIDMDACCPEPCPPEFETPPEKNRTKGTWSWYCGYSEGAEGSVDDSITGEDCEDEFEVEIMVNFDRTELECCQKCNCYGDPRCYAFDDTFDEFILCDGRTPGATPEDRCVIRKATCEAQRDQEGNSCQWYNPIRDPPDYSDPEKQEYEERQYSVARYGSPCRYNQASDAPTILLYRTEAYELEVEQGERGYIQTVFLTLNEGSFEMGAERCLDGQSWEVVSGSIEESTFRRSTYGNEFVWTVVDDYTGIELRIRCTGNLYEGDWSTMFINVEALLEPDDTRIGDSEGFCASATMPEKDLATTEYTDDLRANGLCDHWNEEASQVMRREVARIITDNPGVTNVGTASAYREFCSKFFSPAWSSVSQCQSAFLDADNVQEMVTAFCKAATSEVAACEENMEIMAGEDGYKVAFRTGYSLYIQNYVQQCVVNFSELPTELDMSSDVCETGAELQWYNPRVEEWITYAAFPDDGACTGYTVIASYRWHPKLFKNPLRIVQRHNFDGCSQCTQASAVSGWFTFFQEPAGRW